MSAASSSGCVRPQAGPARRVGAVSPVVARAASVLGAVAALSVVAVAQPPLPDNPCDVLTARQMAAASGLEITGVRRKPSVTKLVEAQREGRDPEPGTLCIYDTASTFGELMIAVPRRAERTSAHYYQNRDRYIATYGRSGQPVAGVGQDAWLAGRTRLTVLLRQDESFVVQTQMYSPRSPDVVVAVAREIVRRW